ncbi:MAG: ThuA domain-containing protein [Planctomycetota bacterium]|nr:ThuA domain-containing protein [Planctomycetota bacterium]
MSNFIYLCALGMFGLLLSCSASKSVQGSSPALDPRWLVYPGQPGATQHKRVVFVAGDEEYRSEEALPMLARLLSEHHGFECVVLFSQNPDTGEIDPNESSHIPGLHLIENADLLVLDLRFRELRDEDMAHIMGHMEAGKPLIGIRTTTHAFNYKQDKGSPYAKWTWTSKDPAGGFGGEFLGETWVAHHGKHGSQATRGVIAAQASGNPILHGVLDVFGTTDVYAIRALPSDATVLLHGAVLDGMDADSPLVDSAKNDPMHPIVWTRQREWAPGRIQRVLSTTIGAATDWSSEDLRRLFMNGVFWTLGMEDQIPAEGLNATMFGDWNPTPFGFNAFRTGQFPADYRDGIPPLKQ